MKNNETRLSNLVKMKGGNSIFQVDEIGKEFIHMSNILDCRNWANVDYESIEGIPVTEEFLLKLGFTTEVPKYLKLRFNEFVSDYILFDVDDKYFLFLKGDQDWLCKLDYVHQLQNLYFSLTKQELIISK